MCSAVHDSCVAELLHLTIVCIHTESVATAAQLLPAQSSYFEFIFDNNQIKMMIYPCLKREKVVEGGKEIGLCFT